MAIQRSINNVNTIIDWTEEINEIDSQYGFVRSLNLFNTKGTSQTAIVFNKNQQDITLLPQTSRQDRQPSTGKPKTSDTFSLALSYFKHADTITPEDIQGLARKGGNGEVIAESLENVRIEKLTTMRLAADQTDEYMQLQAMKGIFKTPDGRVMANMFTEFGITQKEVDFKLGTASTDLDAKFNEVKRHIAKNVKTGGAIQGVDFYVDAEFFDKLIAHPRFREIYNSYMNSGKQNLRDNLGTYFQWGISDVVEHRGIRVISYDAEFNLPDGTTELAFEASTGTALALGVRDLFRGYNGPSNKLNGANQVGQPLFAYEYVDPKDEFMDMEIEMAKLYFCTKPNTLVSLVSSD